MGVEVTFKKLRADAAKHIGIDPDRLSIKPMDEAYYFEVKIEGKISIEAEYALRQYLHQHSPLWARWQVRATVQAYQTS